MHQNIAVMQAAILVEERALAKARVSKYISKKYQAYL
jgi:hypothetical protein